KGLSVFTPPENPFAKDCKIKFQNYNESDGLPINNLTRNSAFCDTDGTLYFGTVGGGLFYFKPTSLKENDYVPNVSITGFRLLNREVNVHDSSSVLKLPIEYTKEISLGYRQNTVSFSFAALSFIRPEDNRYAYMLEGFDQHWIYTSSSDRLATY